MAFDFARLKESFLDVPKVRDAVEKGGRKGCERHGAFVRRTAKNSIKNAPKIDVATGEITKKRKGVTLKDATAKSPNPPFSHRGDLKRLVLFAWDPSTLTIVVGPAVFTGKDGPGVATRVLEHSGVVVRSKLVSAKGNGLGRPASDRQRETFFRLVKEGRIRGHARKRIQVTARYKGNAFMGPADAKERAKFAQQMKDTVSK
jgi:hypothetical protein